MPNATTPVKTIKIAFHVMQREAPFEKDNFDENVPSHVAYLNELFNRINSLFSFCNVQWCNGTYQGGLNYNRDSRIQFELVKIYYWRDNVGYINEDGNYANTYCYDHYGICKDEVINVFFCQTLSGTSGYGPPSHVMMLNQFNEYQNSTGGSWGGGNLLGHELGHIFGINHSWLDFPSYPDMCQYEYDHGVYCEQISTDMMCSNNMMSYANIRDYIAPSQMARMHETLLSSPASKYLKTEYDANQAITINSPTTWNYSRLVLGDVTIKPGATLTITCKTIMGKDTRIIVERGARLIVDGALITTKGKTQSICSGTTNTDRWTGIEVWGNTSVVTNANMLLETYVLQATDPGVVILKNEAVIEHAQVGIYAQRRAGPWNSQQQHWGGLVSVNDATFKNCRKAAEYISDIPLKNSSVFKVCTFDQTFLGTSLTNPVKTYEGVTSWQVNDILFDQCIFNNLERGIVMGNATTSVIGSNFDKNKFAVELGMVAPTVDAQTLIGGDGNKNTFKYCDWSVYAKSYGYVIVKNNLFEDCTTGVILEGSSVYRIEENTFKNTNIIGNPAFVTGIALIQSGTASANNILCNQYISVQAAAGYPPIRDGLYVGGNNKGTYFDKNKFSCWYDVRVTHLYAGSTLVKGELPTQGGQIKPVFNEYTPFTIPEHKAEIHTANPTLGLSSVFKYYHPTGTCGVSQLIPRKPVSGTCFVPLSTDNLANYNFENASIPSTSVPTCSFGPIGSIVRIGDCRTKACLDNYYIQIASKDNLLNPGNSTTLYTNIQTAPNASSTLSALNAVSPYLSEDVLAEVLNSSVMSGSNKRNVLAANLPLSAYINSLSKQKLTTTEFNSLSSLSQPGQVSLRDNAIEERTNLNNKKMALLRHLTDSLFRVGNVFAADNLLAADPEQFSREARVGLKLQTADYTGASHLLSIYASSSQADVDFKFIQTINLQRITGVKPSPVDSTTLLALALSFSPQAGYAKSLAGVLYGRIFEPVIIPPSSPIVGDESSEDRNTGNEVVISSFSFFPNPANESLTVNTPTVLSSEKSEMMIFSAQGKLLLR